MLKALLTLILLFQFNPLAHASGQCDSHLSRNFSKYSLTTPPEKINYKDIFRSSRRFNTTNSQASYAVLKSLAKYGDRPWKYSRRAYTYISKFMFSQITSSSLISDDFGYDSTENYLKCGTCSKMFEMHFKATVIPLSVVLNRLSLSKALRIDKNFKDSAGKFIILKYRGVNLGAIKLLGSETYQISYSGYFSGSFSDGPLSIPNPTFLSFRNVYDSAGRQVLSTGGVYNIPRDFFNEVLVKEVNRQGAFYGQKDFFKKFKPVILDVTELNFKPETFVLNNEAWDRPDRFVQNILDQFGYNSEYFLQIHHASQEIIDQLKDVTSEDLQKLIKLLGELPDQD